MFFMKCSLKEVEEYTTPIKKSTQQLNSCVQEWPYSNW